MNLRMKIAAIIGSAMLITGASLGISYAASAATNPPYAKVTTYNISATDHNATFSWTAAYGGTGTTIRVLVYDANTGTAISDVNQSGTLKSSTTKALSPGTAYDVKFDVAASSTRSNSGWSTPRLFFTKATSGSSTTGPQGPQGDPGTPGAKGDTGAQGPSGIVEVNSSELVSSPMSIATGGGFVANSTEVGTLDLKAGTYLLTLNAKATPNVSTTAQVFPQFMVYDQVKNANFTGDLFNMGTGELEPFATNHDSYYSGFKLLTLPVDTTLHVYAFGYDSDSGAATYQLSSLKVDVTQVTPAN